MNINTGKALKTLKGEDYTADKEPLTIGKVIAEALAGDETGGKYKLYTLADKAFNSKTMEVDAPDLALIKNAVEKCKTYNNLIIGQTLGILEESK